MPFIRECIVTSIRDDKSIHIAPMGIHEDGEHLIILPFKPSATLDNLERDGTATLNYTDDVRVYAGCLTGHRDWPTCPTDVIKGVRLENCLAHTELEVFDKVEDDGGHAFYLGIEHARAQIAWQLGKRYEQDEELVWGVTTKSTTDDLSKFKEAGTTMHTRKTRKDKRQTKKKKK